MTQNNKRLMPHIVKARGLRATPVKTQVPEDLTRMTRSPGLCEPIHKVHKNLGGLSLPTYKKKWWGYEKTFINGPWYTMKELWLEDGGHTSLHFHVEKHETIYVISGTLAMEIRIDKNMEVYKLPEGHAWIVPPGYPHRLLASYGDVTLMEASTYDQPSDSIRLY